MFSLLKLLLIGLLSNSLVCQPVSHSHSQSVSLSICCFSPVTRHSFLFIFPALILPLSFPPSLKLPLISVSQSVSFCIILFFSLFPFFPHSYTHYLPHTFPPFLSSSITHTRKIPLLNESVSSYIKILLSSSFRLSLLLFATRSHSFSLLLP